MLLRDEREFILEEKLENDRRGKSILEILEVNASPTDIDRVYNYLVEVEQITKLSVGLTIRLGRMDRILERNDLGEKDRVS